MDWVRVLTGGGLLVGLVEAIRVLTVGRAARRVTLVRAQQEVLDNLHEGSTVRDRLRDQIDHEIEAFIDTRTVLRWRWWLVVVAVPAAIFGLACLFVAIFDRPSKWELWVNGVPYTVAGTVLLIRAMPTRQRQQFSRWILGERPPSPSPHDPTEPPDPDRTST
jgi:hypothetical protein